MRSYEGRHRWRCDHHSHPRLDGETWPGIKRFCPPGCWDHPSPGLTSFAREYKGRHSEPYPPCDCTLDERP